MPQTVYLSKTQEEIIKYLLKGERDRLEWEFNEVDREYWSNDNKDAEDIRVWSELKQSYNEVNRLYKKLYGDP